MGKTKNYNPGINPYTGKEFLIIQNINKSLSIIASRQTRVGAEAHKQELKELNPLRKYYIIEKSKLARKIKTTYKKVYVPKVVEETHVNGLGDKVKVSVTKRVKKSVIDYRGWDKNFDVTSLKKTL